MSIRTELFEKAKESQKRKKIAEGYTDAADEQSSKLASQFCAVISDRASQGDMSHFFDMAEHNFATINLVSIIMKEQLGDVLVIVSPRGITADWKMSE